MGHLRDCVDRLDAAMARGDFEEVASYYAYDAVFEDGTQEVVGRSEIVDYWRQAFSGVIDATVETIRVVEAGDSLAIETKTTATHVASGRRLRVPAMAHLRFRDGLIIEEHQYLDTGLIQAQLAPMQTASPLDAAGTPRDVAEAMTAAYDATDWEAFGECFHDDAVMEFMGQRYEGRAAIVEHQRTNPTQVERRDWLVADDERVWSRWTASFDADGRRVTTTGVGMSQVREGRVELLAMWIDLSFMLPSPS